MTTYMSNLSKPVKLNNTLTSLQDYLSVGYLYLLLLGILSDSIYYGLMGVNIISYAGISDILLSPVVYLTKSIIFPVMILVIPILVIWLMQRSQTRVQKELNQNKRLTDKERSVHMQKLKTLGVLKLILPLFAILSAYIGYALGGGETMSDRIKGGNFSLTHEITYRTGESENVRIIGNNSQYMFYVVEGHTELTVAPISGNIKQIEKIANE